MAATRRTDREVLTAYLGPTWAAWFIVMLKIAVALYAIKLLA